jgi:hypothetical protein
MITVRIPDDLRDRIDAIRPATVSREAWIRSACTLKAGLYENPLETKANLLEALEDQRTEPHC